MRVYGLTGGVASGKSEAARRFTALGVPVIDADNVGHELIEPGGEAIEEVLKAFGQEILTHGKIDRAKLGERVFADAGALLKLNDILHPLITRTIVERCKRLMTEGREVVIVEAALLAEKGVREPWLDGLILVTCPREVRISRLIARGLSPLQARQRVEAQSAPETKMALADWLIDNAGTLDQLYAQVAVIAEALRGTVAGNP